MAQITPAQKLEDAIQAERELCRCAERLVKDEDGNYVCSSFCAGCRNYDALDIKCDIRENVRVALCEDDEYRRLGLDDVE